MNFSGINRIGNFLIRASKKFVQKTNSSTPESHGVMAVRNRFEDIKNLIQKDDPIIVDGGANKGNMIDIFIAQYRAPIIYAFEPIPDLVKKLKEKYRSMENIHVYQKALGSSNSTIPFNILNYQNASSVFKPGRWNYKYHQEKMNVEETIQVEQVRLDDVLKGKAVDIIKLDLQGYELEALKGMENLLDNIKIIDTEIEFVHMWENQPLFADIDICLRKHGFRLLNLYELWTHHDGQLSAGDAVYLNNRFFDF